MNINYLIVHTKHVVVLTLLILLWIKESNTQTPSPTTRDEPESLELDQERGGNGGGDGGDFGSEKGLPGVSHELKFNVEAGRQECLYQWLKAGANLHLAFEVSASVQRSTADWWVVLCDSLVEGQCYSRSEYCCQDSITRLAIVVWLPPGYRSLGCTVYQTRILIEFSCHKLYVEGMCLYIYRYHLRSAVNDHERSMRGVHKCKRHTSLSVTSCTCSILIDSLIINHHVASITGGIAGVI